MRFNAVSSGSMKVEALQLFLHPVVQHVLVGLAGNPRHRGLLLDAAPHQLANVPLDNLFATRKQVARQGVLEIGRGLEAVFRIGRQGLANDVFQVWLDIWVWAPMLGTLPARTNSTVW